MSLFNKNRCKICKEEKAVRECPRKGTSIGWSCCNSMRYDMKCPNTCEYHLPVSNSLEFKIKADSLQESNDLVLRLFDIWSLSVHPEIGESAPLELAQSEEGRAILEKYFSRIKFMDTLPINKIRNKLKLPSVDLPENNDFEKAACEIMDIIIEGDWSKLIDKFYQQEELQTEKNREIFTKRNEKSKVFKKIKEYSLVSSSLNREAEEALIHFYVNKKADITLNMIQINKKWFLKSRIIGDPQLYYGEETAIKNIASLLSKNEMEEVWKLCDKYVTIYPDSADIEYYWGLYHSISENIKEAKKHFEASFILDPTFAEALYNLGFISQVEKKNDEAREIYKRVLEINPQEVKTINNLAIIHIEKQEWNEALVLLKKCMEINPQYDIAQKNYEIVKRKVTESVK